MKYAIIIFAVVALIGVGGFLFIKKQLSPSTSQTASPTDEPIKMLEADQQPKINLTFKPDGNFVTVNLTNLHAGAIEYNLIYDAKIKRNGITSQVNTGVTGSAKVSGQSTYSKEELLGSESSGKKTFHEDIQNAVVELTLRDDSGRSIFTATYPFKVTAGKSIDLTPAQ